MELADIRDIELLTETYKKKRDPRPVMTKNAAPGRYEAPRHKSRRCECGTCGTCRDNARWERIFTEKFADPAYYGGLAIRHESPIHRI
ncbi:MAG TPA: hypothetical protein VHW09_27215 [Bryobacteraceae bacterium]|nr:hypothetical protein [Bryobacteraceae bacterium]